MEVRLRYIFNVTEEGWVRRGSKGKGIVGKFSFRIVCQNQIPFSLKNEAIFLKKCDFFLFNSEIGKLVVTSPKEVITFPCKKNPIVSARHTYTHKPKDIILLLLHRFKKYIYVFSMTR